MNDAIAFGRRIRELRVKLGVSLRQFCLDNELDALTINRIERGIPPAHSTTLPTMLARALCLHEDTPEWHEFIRLAEAASSTPMPTLTDEQIVTRLPLLFRTDSGKPISPDKLRVLIERIRRSDLGY